MVLSDKKNEKKVSIAFTGDLSFTKYFSNAKEMPVADDKLREFISSADYCVGNIEGPVMGTLENSKQFAHYTNADKAGMIAGMNIKIWNIANNHTLDFGGKGVSDTIDNAEKNGCIVIGGGESAERAAEPLIIEGAGGIGVISMTYSAAEPKDKSSYRCFNWDDTERIKNSVERIKSSCRWCVMVVHGGDEFASMPMPYTRDRYLKLLEMGADVIVAHHPHVIQNYETVGDKIIFYSLGNFIFDTDYQRAQFHTEEGMLLKLAFSEDKVSFEAEALKIDRKANNIVKTNAPPIFADISESEYKKLWKLAARKLTFSERKMHKYLKPKKFAKYNSFLWFLREIYMCRRKRERTIALGKACSCFARTKNEPLKEYLKIK